MGLTFPTGHSTVSDRAQIQMPVLGEPRRANPCRCGTRHVLDPSTDQCARCGRYTGRTIAKTWHDRAQKIAARR